jgi:hypothetical protein
MTLIKTMSADLSIDSKTLKRVKNTEFKCKEKYPAINGYYGRKKKIDIKTMKD